MSECMKLEFLSAGSVELRYEIGWHFDSNWTINLTVRYRNKVKFIEEKIQDEEIIDEYKHWIYDETNAESYNEMLHRLFFSKFISRVLEIMHDVDNLKDS